MTYFGNYFIIYYRVGEDMKNGFTLVELLVVIVIIGLISTIAYPSVMGIINASKDRAYESQKLIVEKAAKEWGVEHTANLPDSGSCCVSVTDLVSEGYIENEAVNPKGGMLGGYVEIKLESNQYVYAYVNECTPSCLK